LAGGQKKAVASSPVFWRAHGITILFETQKETDRAGWQVAGASGMSA
jgi:hypothetical protein